MEGKPREQDYAQMFLRFLQIKISDTTLNFDPSKVIIVSTSGKPREFTWSTTATVALPGGNVRIDGSKMHAEISLFDEATVMKVARMEWGGSSFVEFVVREMKTLSKDATGIMGKMIFAFHFAVVVSG